MTRLKGILYFSDLKTYQWVIDTVIKLQFRYSVDGSNWQYMEKMH